MKEKKEFIEILISRFPAIREEVLDEGYSFSINLQMGVLKRFVQEAIDNGKIETVQEVFLFLESMIGQVTQNIKNAIYIAFLSHLDFSKRHDYKCLLKGDLKTGLEDIERYHQEGAKGDAKNFLDSIK